MRQFFSALFLLTILISGAAFGQSSRVEQKGKSSFDSDFQYEYEP